MYKLWDSIFRLLTKLNFIKTIDALKNSLYLRFVAIYKRLIISRSAFIFYNKYYVLLLVSYFQPLRIISKRTFYYIVNLFF
jgi:hypothetical protein